MRPATPEEIAALEGSPAPAKSGKLRKATAEEIAALDVDHATPEEAPFLTPGYRPPETPLPKPGTQELAQELRTERENAPGAAETAARKAAQGLTLGHADEIAGIVASEPAYPGMTPAMVAQRDTTKGKEAQAEFRYRENEGAKYHPIASGLGTIGGIAAPALVSAVTAPIRAAEAVTVSGQAVRGLATGAAAGHGYSEADTLGGKLRDTVIGGTLGAVIGAGSGKVIKVLEGAPERAQRELLTKTIEKATPTVKKKAEDFAGGVVEAQKKYEFDKIADPLARNAAVKDATKKAGEDYGAAFKTLSSEALGVKVDQIRGAVRGYVSGLSGPSDKAIKKQAESYLKTLESEWGGMKRIPLDRLNAEIGKLEKIGYKAANPSDAAGAQFRRDIARRLEDIKQARLAEISDIGAKVAATPLAQREAFAGLVEAGKAADSLAAMDREYRALKLIGEATKEQARAAKVNGPKESGGIVDALKNAVKDTTHGMAAATDRGIVAAGEKAPLAVETGKQIVNIGGRTAEVGGGTVPGRIPGIRPAYAKDEKPKKRTAPSTAMFDNLGTVGGGT